MHEDTVESNGAELANRYPYTIRSNDEGAVTTKAQQHGHCTGTGRCCDGSSKLRSRQRARIHSSNTTRKY